MSHIMDREKPTNRALDAAIAELVLYRPARIQNTRR